MSMVITAESTNGIVHKWETYAPLKPNPRKKSPRQRDKDRSPGHVDKGVAQDGIAIQARGGRHKPQPQLQPFSSALYRCQACPKCGGTLVLDSLEEWDCLNCGAVLYPHGPLPLIIRTRKKRDIMGSVNVIITAQEKADAKWRSKNQEIITLLDEGGSVKDVASITGRGLRQVRGVYERLQDIHKAEGLHA